MTIGILKDILLVLMGGFITFLFTILIGRIQRLQPRMVWRTFPAIHIAREGLSGISWLIENTGRKSAKNVRVTFLLPEKASFTSFEIEPSEPALSYSLSDAPSKTSMKSIIIPIFTQGVSISISSLISGLGDDIAKVSIVGEDIVGTEKSGISEEDVEKRRRRFSKVYVALYGLMILSTVFVLALASFMSIEVMKYKHTEMIADLYLKAKDYDTAINLYETYRKNQVLGRDWGLSDYQLARIHALKGDKQRSILFLQQLPKKNYEKRIEQDPGFDNIRSSPEFQEYLRKLKAS